jgi:di/tricarboxylate transporter
LDKIIVYIVVLFLLVTLYFNLLRPALAFVVGILVLGVAGILTPAEILSGFANDQVIVILILLVIGDIIRKRGLMNGFFERFLFRGAWSYRAFSARMMITVAAASAFLNNTPIVAVMLPYVRTWSIKNKVAPGKLMIPLSYAAILGGTITLVGTSTNLIVNGMLRDQTVFPGYRSLHIFDFAWVGLPMTLVGLLFVLLLGRYFLPGREKEAAPRPANIREYLVEVSVDSHSDLAGRTVGKSNLRNLKGLFLVSVRRGKGFFTPVEPSFRLEAGDVLGFAGDPAAIADLIEIHSGLQPLEAHDSHLNSESTLKELIVAHNSHLIGTTVKEMGFRSKYDASVIAVHRNGERLAGKIGDIRIQPGDILLILAGRDFDELSEDPRAFYPISNVREFKKARFRDALILLGGLGLVILLSALQLVPLFMGAVILLLLIIVTRMATPREVHLELDYNLGLIIALGLALGIAMSKTGVAADVSHFFIEMLRPFGMLGLLIALYLSTALLAAYITNKAAVAIAFPIAIAIAYEKGMDPMPFVLLIAYAAAANFMTPIGYQTNLMVYGPGNYRFPDYLRIGLPLTVIYGVGAVAILYFMYF